MEKSSIMLPRLLTGLMCNLVHDAVSGRLVPGYPRTFHQREIASPVVRAYTAQATLGLACCSIVPLRLLVPGSPEILA